MYVIDLLHTYAATAKWRGNLCDYRKRYSGLTPISQPEDAFHFARKDVPLDPPVLEHSHDFFELLMVEQGAVHHWINGLEERLEAGTLVFIRPSDRHALQSVPGRRAHPQRDVPCRHRSPSGRALRRRCGAASSGPTARCR
jgi:mannose-6-phosphate isomerase-like protein (cupin superfamily)